MAIPVKQSTAVTVPVMCFGTDGITAITAAYTSAQISVLKPGETAAITALGGQSTIHAGGGCHLVPLATGDVSALGAGGKVFLAAGSTTQAPAWADIDIIPAITYDTFYGSETARLSALTTRGTAALTSTDIVALTTAQVVTLTTASVASLQTVDIGALATTSQINALLTSGITALTTTQIEAITGGVWDELSGDHTTNGSFGELGVAYWNSWAIDLDGAYAAGQVGYRLNELFNGALDVGASVNKWLGTGVDSALTATSIPAITAAQMTTTQLGGQSTQFVSSLTSADIPALDTAQISALLTSGITVLESNQLGALPTQEISTLTTADIAALIASDVPPAILNADVTSYTTPNTVGEVITDTLSLVTEAVHQASAGTRGHPGLTRDTTTVTYTEDLTGKFIDIYSITSGVTGVISSSLGSLDGTGWTPGTGDIVSGSFYFDCSDVPAGTLSIEFVDTAGTTHTEDFDFPEITGETNGLMFTRDGGYRWLGGSAFGPLANTGATIADMDAAGFLKAIIPAQNAVDVNAAGAVATQEDGGGTVEETITLIDQTTSLPIADVAIWISTDLAGANIVASEHTDAFGIATFYLDPGSYFTWKHKDGYNFTNPTSLTVVAP